MSTQDDLTIIPMKHAYWHTWSLHAAHTLLWIGFWFGMYHAWTDRDGGLLVISLMLLAIGLLIFRGVAYVINAWVIWSQYISLREMNGKQGADRDDAAW